MTYFPASSLSGTHQEALAFTLQKIRGEMAVGSQYVGVGVYLRLTLALFTCDPITQDAFLNQA